MKILAAFDGSKCSEAIVPQLEWMARLSDAQFTFLSIVRRPCGTALEEPSQTAIASAAATATLAGDRGEAVEPAQAERSVYLQDMVSRMPRGPKYSVEVTVGDDVAAAIIRYSMRHKPDIIVMGTHGETGMVHRLFGDVAEQVVRSGVAPVLLVHPNTARASRSSSEPS
ncbi:MAG: universal stress protein [Dehalococcoidia bacterium]